MCKSHREVKELKMFKRLQMICYRFNSRYVCDYLDFGLGRILHSSHNEYSEDKRKYLNLMKGNLNGLENPCWCQYAVFIIMGITMR